MPSISDTSAPARQRRRTTHVKSGCRTCKVRRVKCDEKRPSCGKCLVSGRVCDGYGIWGQPSIAQTAIQQQHATSPSYSLPALPDLANEEKRYLDRFRNLLVDKLSQPFGSHFWSSVVTQLSMTEPAVLHASIALASAYDSLVPGSGQVAATDSALPASFTLRQYNRAIRALTSKVSPEALPSLRAAVVSCVLFICLEIMRGDANAMQAHFSSGIQLLRQLQHGDRTSSSKGGTILVKHHAEALDDHLVDVFTRLNLHFLMLGHGSQLKQTFVPSFINDRRMWIPRRFFNSNQARQSLTVILVSSIHLLKEAEQHTFSTNLYPPPPSAAVLERQDTLQAGLSEWVAAYDNSIDELRVTESSNHRLGLIMLRIYADMFIPLLATSLSIKETAYDAHTPVFESLIKSYREVLDSHSNPFFTIDIGFFPPVYCTVLKCRDSRIRHEALSLLRRFRHMEGPWTGPILAKVAEYVVNLEEEHFQGAQSSVSGIVLPEFCRIFCVECRLPNPESSSPNTWSLILKRFRHELGKAGGWDVRKHEIEV
ncbi:hypothetical protein BJX70DRAFT_392452 [Aspergillus crustosus]